jgi:hypothetical protein
VFYLAESGFGLKDKNPFDQCCFYEKSSKKKQITNEKNSKKVTMLKPEGII